MSYNPEDQEQQYEFYADPTTAAPMMTTAAPMMATAAPMMATAAPMMANSSATAVAKPWRHRMREPKMMGKILLFLVVLGAIAYYLYTRKDENASNAPMQFQRFRFRR